MKVGWLWPNNTQKSKISKFVEFKFIHDKMDGIIIQVMPKLILLPLLIDKYGEKVLILQLRDWAN